MCLSLIVELKIPSVLGSKQQVLSLSLLEAPDRCLITVAVAGEKGLCQDIFSWGAISL